MDIDKEYTTFRLMEKDKEGIEAKKIEVSEEAFLTAKMAKEIIDKLEKIRTDLI